VVVFDDDLYITAAVIAELLARDGLDVTYVTPAGNVSAWSRFTAEQSLGQRRLIELGVKILTGQIVAGLDGNGARLTCAYTGGETAIPCGGFVPVTSREPNDGLWAELLADPAANEAAGLSTILRIGDCKAPGLIATAVYDGHRAAREFGKSPEECIPRRERATVA
jgi:dimethylamine/trimethylamine dehydrogenase